MVRTNLFSQFVVVGGGHVTYEFKPKECRLPCREGETVIIREVGHYGDNLVACMVVEVELPDGKILTHQPNGTVLHRTLWTNTDVPPKMSGERATANGWNQVEGGTYTATAKFYTIGED